jgi:metal-dependent amidase/aminoacylase/carboxypeptidase family protein
VAGTHDQFRINDPVMIAAGLAQALQSIVSRNTDPLKAIVLSITRMEAGASHNVIPETAQLTGTIRTLDADVRAMAANRFGPRPFGPGDPVPVRCAGK